jgi:hypothetical protein
LAEDLERYLAGEPVLAVPSAYERITAEKIEQHLRDLDGWRTDQVISEAEHDTLRRGYDRLFEREDAWIMEVRRLSLAQVSLYLGEWLLVTGAALIFLFKYQALQGTLAVAIVTIATALTGYVGVRCWREGRLRTGVAYLLAFCLLLPVTLLVGMTQYGVFTFFTQGREDLELLGKVEGFQTITNAQLWWSILLSLPADLWLRRFTLSSVFSLVFAVMVACWSQASLLRMGMMEWISHDPGIYYLHLIPVAFAFFLCAIALERLRKPADSRYFYPFAVAFTIGALSGLAGQHKSYAAHMESLFPWTRGQVEYLFIVNAMVYFFLQGVCERLHSPLTRTVAKVFRFVIPGHVMTSLLLLGLEATNRLNNSQRFWAVFEARTFEVILPVVAACFVFLCIPNQMKNYLASGLVFLAIGIVRLEQNWFQNRAAWPIALLIIASLLMLMAPNYAGVRVTVIRWLQRKA